MSVSSTSVTVTHDHIKEYLKAYSRFLRRDFLAILVKMCSKELSIKTVRSDWRTRKGMFNFLAQCWNGLLILLQEKTIFQWFCIHFENIEKILSHRKFVMFLYNNWNKYGNFLGNVETVLYLQKKQTELSQVLNGSSSCSNSSELQIPQQIHAIFTHFLQGMSKSPEIEKIDPVVSMSSNECKTVESEVLADNENQYSEYVSYDLFPDDTFIVEDSFSVSGDPIYMPYDYNDLYQNDNQYLSGDYIL